VSVAALSCLALIPAAVGGRGDVLVISVEAETDIVISIAGLLDRVESDIQA